MRALSLAVALLAGCAPGLAEPCAGPTCHEGLECLANRCVPQGGTPVPERARRVTALPSRMAIVSQESPRARVPPTATLGSKVDGATRWFLAFDPLPHAADAIARAFLLLTPAPGDGTDDFLVDVWTIHDDWSAADVRYRTHPPMGRPHAEGLSRSRPPALLRIDVTDIVRHQVRRQAEHGMVVAAERGEGHGAQYFTGVSGGAAPTLEVYVED